MIVAYRKSEKMNKLSLSNFNHLVGKCMSLRKIYSKASWCNFKNFFLRTLGKKSAYQELVEKDIRYSNQLKSCVQKFVKDNNLSNIEIEETTSYLKVFLSKSEERIKFLIAFPFLQTKHS